MDDPDAAPGPFDPGIVGALRSLTADDEPDAFAYLSGCFVSEAVAALEILRMAIAREDAEAAGHVVHALKGSAANIGAVRVAAACRELEHVLPGGTRAAAPAAARICAEFEQAQAWLSEEGAASQREAGTGSGP